MSKTLALLMALTVTTITCAADPAAPILLGGNELTAGIAGEGPLKVEEIKSWLANDKNHEPLTVELPLGLAAGTSQIYIPKDNPLTRAKIELGRQLYFDPRLSADGKISCATCHAPDSGWAKQTRFGVGIGGLTGGRNSPTSYNRLLSKEQFWDGRADSLEDQAIGPIANPIEMGFTHDECVGDLKKIPGYVLQFEKIFPDEGINIKTVGKAIAAFERVIITGPSPADYYEPLVSFQKAFKTELADLESFKADSPDEYEQYQAMKKASDAHPISDSAKRGRDLFFGKANCTACHVGANFSDEKYHNLGVGMDAAKPDLGRYEVTKKDADRGAFKTPTIRNVAQTAPYMHDGSQQTLEEVVEWYDKGGHANPHLSDKMKKLNLTAQENKDLVEYMKALTGPFPKVATARLP